MWRISLAGPMLSIFLLASCATESAIQSSNFLISEGRIEDGLNELEKAMQKSPRNHEIRNYYFRQRDFQLNNLLNQAELSRQSKSYAQAEALYRRVLAIDTNNRRASEGLESIKLEQKHIAIMEEAENAYKKNDLNKADQLVQNVLAENPKNKEAIVMKRLILSKYNTTDLVSPILKSSISKPIAMQFQDAPIRSVFELLSRNAGINFIFDKDVRPDTKVTLFIKNSTVEDVIRLVTLTNQLEQKALNENTILIYPNTDAKQKDYQELVTKSFYIANADVKTLANTIKTLVKTKDMVVDEKLNYIAIRDTPEAVRLAERLIANQDIPDPEVILELEVLEVSSNRLKELGIRYPEQVGFNVSGEDKTPGTLTLNEAKNFNSGLVRLTVTNPSLILNLRRTDTDTNLLGNPRIRVKNKNKAKVHVGERVPVITTTSTANVGVSESVSYLDVGLKLEVEPSISLDDEVTILVGLEVSNILETITRASGLQTYRLGTRNASTTLMLKDGETQVLAGLIQDDERRTANNVPGLADLPILGRLFSNRFQTNTKTEIVLLITPRIVRNIVRPPAQDSEFLSGTNAFIGASPVRLRATPSQKESKPISPTTVPSPPSPPVSDIPSDIPSTVKSLEELNKEGPSVLPPPGPSSQKPTLPLPAAFALPVPKPPAHSEADQKQTVIKNTTLKKNSIP